MGQPDAPALVFLHGVLTNAAMYDHLAVGLAATRRVIGLDQRGHGDSPHTGEYGWAAFARDHEALWDALDLGTADLVGHSMGAGHAADLAALRPDAVRRLVLVDQPFWCWTTPEEQAAFWTTCAALQPEDGFDSPQHYLDTVAQAFPRADRSAAEVNTADLRLGDDGRWRWRRPPDLAVFGAHATDDERRDHLNRIRCPTLVVRSALSEVFAPGGAKEIAAVVSDGQAVEVPDCGHMVMWENVPGVASAILEFLDEGADAEP